MPIVGYSQYADIPWHSRYWYDSLDIRSFKTYKVKVHQNDTIIYQYSEYSYDPEKDELELDYFNESGQRIKKGTKYFIFNDCGVLIEKKNKGAQWVNEMCIDTPDTTYKYLNAVFTTDSIGRIISRASDTLYVGNGFYHASRKTFEYDSSGFLTKTHELKKNGLDSILVATDVLFTYNDKKQLVSISSTTKEGSIIRLSKSWIKYDDVIPELYSTEIIEESP